MTRYDSPRLLTPPREEEEVYPYRHVWRSLAVEVGILFGVTFLLYLMIGRFRIQVPERLTRPVNLGIALLPMLLWGGFSLWRERVVLEPRRHLAGVFVISALAANAIGIPLLDALQINQWLPFLSMINRIVGYAVTVGIVQEMLKYLIVRYTVWPDCFRIRQDSVAYFTAAAVGYATVMNLRLFTGTPVSPDVFAIRVFSTTTVHLAASVFVAYGLAEVQFNPRIFYVMPLMMFFSTLITGVATAARSSIVNAKFLLGLAATRPLFGLGVSLGVVIGALAVAAFLFSVAERTEREAVASREV